jgi:signal transduction histidine kinase
VEFQQRQHNWQALLQAIAAQMQQVQSLEGILDYAIGTAQRELDCDRLVLSQFKADWSTEITYEAVEAPWKKLLGTTVKDPCFSEQFVDRYRQGRIHVLDETRRLHLTSCYSDLLSFFQIQATVVLPVCLDHQLWGLLVAHQCGHSRKWTAWEIEALQRLASQMAVALHNAQLRHQVQGLQQQMEHHQQHQMLQLKQSIRFERLLKRIADKVRESLDEQQILQTAVQELALGLQVDGCDTRLYSGDRKLSTIHCEHLTTLRPAKGQTLRISEAPDPQVFAQSLQGQHSQFCLLPTRNPNLRKFLRTQHRPLAMLVYPLYDEAQIVGDLWLFKAAHKHFSEIEIRLVQQVANQCAIALRQARLYKAAQSQVKELERLNRLKDDFLSTISHELRTPMSSIKQVSEMLELALMRQQDSIPNYGELSRLFQILGDECEREIRLINDLLELSRLDADTEPLLLTPIHLPHWLPHLVEPFIERARNQKLSLQVDLPELLPDVTTDMSALARVVTELLNNACKYTPGGERICVSAGLVEEGAGPAGQMLPDPILSGKTYSGQVPIQAQISITNSGTDIPSHELERIFDKFYRIPNNDPWKHGGTGLGLALVKKLTEQHLGGTIQVHSGGGETTFTLVLPLQPSPERVERI